MIQKVLNEDIFDTPHSHIAFAINTEGINDSGFAGEVFSRFAPELVYTGPRKLGEVVSITSGDKTFHGMVCHSLDRGWGDNSSEVIISCLEKIETKNNEPIAVVLMGVNSGGDVIANAKAIHKANKTIVLYSLEYGQEAIFHAMSLMK